MMSARSASLAAATVGALLALTFGPSLARAASPQWSISSVSRPTNFAPLGNSDGDTYDVLVTNTGSAPSSGRITVTDELPEGLAPAPDGPPEAEDELLKAEASPGASFSETCEPDGEEGKVSCTFEGVVQPDDTLALSFPVAVSATGLTTVTNVVRVSGGGAPSAAMETPTEISPDPAGFGISPGGASSTLSSAQAGAHADLTVSTAFNTENFQGATSGSLKNTIYDLPPGFGGDLVDTPTCAAADFLRERCPIATQVGVTTVTIDLAGEPRVKNIQPVYNLAPEPGDVGKLGFWVKNFFYEGDVRVRAPNEDRRKPPGEAGEPYGLTTTFFNATAGLVAVDNVALTVWGVPAAAVHDSLRWVPRTIGENNGHFGASSNATAAPFLTNPTACGSPVLQASFLVTSWQHPSESDSPPPTSMTIGSLVGCDALVMEPSVVAESTTDRASAPTGLVVETAVPQTYANPVGVASPTLKKEVVTLPEGMTVNPSSGAGLSACTEAQYAEESTSFVAGRGCPNASKLATVRIATPSLKEEAVGSVFLAQPAPFGELGHNPFNSLLAVYLVARIADRGVLIESPGLVQANEITGQLTTTFDNLPPLPFSLATFSFNQGANAPLVTPPTCGTYRVTAALTPYSEPGQMLTPLVPPFAISSGFDGGPCPSGGTPPFSPQVVAGTESNAGGSYSAFDLQISRNDGEQEITGFATSFPPGLSGNLTGIPFCSEAAIAAARTKTGIQEEGEPSCPQASQIGHLVAEAGVGTVLAQAPGKIYLGGPFEGAPFSIVGITAAHVGPFDLGTVVVHLPLDIDPQTAAVSIPAGPSDQIPHIIKGIVIHLREIHAFIDRADFMINPTNCNPMAISATIIGSGANFANPADDVPALVRDPFQAADCSSLKFQPTFKASTSALTSKVNGASLHVEVTYPKVPQGTEANISKVKVELPRDLPSRLTTLQKACTKARFDQNPSLCPAESVVGHAKALTPILPVPLEGPAYFVSNGNAAFPDLIVVLQGYGVRINLVGETFISKAGITSSTFKTVPDQPVTSFELTLPEGRFSALAAYGNLCAPTRAVQVKRKVTVKVKGRKRTVTRKVTENVPAPLVMPTEFVGQNGAVIHQQTSIAVTGCTKPAAKERKKAKKARKAARTVRHARHP
jgi:hypothetical protein